MLVRFRPVTFDGLVEQLATRVSASPAGDWVRVALDGPPPAEPGRLADALVDPLRVGGREVLRIDAEDFLRPASLRFERGRRDPDSRYEDWLDVGGLLREVLAPLDATGTGRVLPALWNAERDRASRADYRVLPRGGVLLLSGELLLGRGLPFDLTVHLWLSPQALARHLPDEQHWSLPAYERYDREVDPVRTADVVVRMDHPSRPALREETGNHDGGHPHP